MLVWYARKQRKWNPLKKDSMPQVYHTPVLLHEAIDMLHINPDGIYVDATFGGGGHSKAILEKLSDKGKLIAFDQDADAKHNIPDDKRILFIHQNFRYMHRYLRLHGIKEVDGVLADLGVSSHQFDEGSRGFSIRFEGPLDMRMDQRNEKTAALVIKTFSELKLHKLFEQYGEVTNARSLAKHIAEQQHFQKVDTVAAFKQMIAPLVKGNPNKYFAQVFQALRIEVNEELKALEEMLEQMIQILKPGGRLAVISFHSLEDRLIKNFMKMGTLEIIQDHPFENTVSNNWLKVITKKPIEAGMIEQKQNTRSRSARLRVAERLNNDRIKY